MGDIIYNKDLVIDVLNTLQYQTKLNGNLYLRDIKIQSPAISITCPFHKNGCEEHPSCGVFIEKYNGWNIGDFHCFTCGAHGNLIDLINRCFDERNESFGKEWLKENFNNLIYTNDLFEEIPLEKPKETFLDEKVLDQFNYYHPYMWERKLTKEVVDKFKVGYDKVNNALTFPVWDEKGRLKFITYRSVKTKRFFIPKDVEKPVYLLNYINKNNITSPVYICESQINTLTCYCYGHNAVGLLGTGTQHQVDLLNKSGVTHFIIALDSDEAGKRGTQKLIKHLKKDKIIDVMVVPSGKDINDLSQREFHDCPIIDSIEWLQTQN